MGCLALLNPYSVLLDTRCPLDQLFWFCFGDTVGAKNGLFCKTAHLTSEVESSAEMVSIRSF